MKKNQFCEDWGKEFQEFMNSPNVEPPKVLSDRILNLVHRDLNPKGIAVFFKLGFIHLIIGTISLLFCPQFGMSLSHNLGLMSLLTRIGGNGFCMAACGAFFLGGSALVSSLFLRPEEIRVLRTNELLQFSTLGILSLGLFIVAGGDVLFDMGALWILGAILGGLFNLELGWALRRRLLFQIV